MGGSFVLIIIITIIVDIPWIDDTAISLQCDWQKQECVFQFWKDTEEQFYCNLSECIQTSNYQVERRKRRREEERVI